MSTQENPLQSAMNKVNNLKDPKLGPPVDISAVIAERKSTHGDFNDHAHITQELKDVMRATANWLVLSATQREGLEMIAHKIGRILAGNPQEPDHWLDVEGYAKITRERL